MTNATTEGRTKGLFMSMEVSEARWHLAFTDLKEERFVSVDSWDQRGFTHELQKAESHFGLEPGTPVYSCYEAGRCGFSIHRFLESKGIDNLVVDPASIEVNRRRKHKKTDRLDAEKLLRMLVRYRIYGERKCWQVCRVPSPQQEAARRLDREYDRLKKERKGHLSRIRALLALHGVRVGSVYHLRPGTIKDWSGRLLAVAWQEEIGREMERLRVVDRQLSALVKRMNEAIVRPKSEVDHIAWGLYQLRGIGVVGATALSRQFFGWREFNNVREVGAAAGLTGCPYDSGGSQVDQGISKAGHRRIRTLAVELAWMWLRFQPTSALSQWYQERFATGGKRLRRIGIVALARKLLVALWKYLHWGLIPQGAVIRM